MEFDLPLRTLIAKHLHGFDVQAAGPSDHRRAAVAVAVTEEGLGARVGGLSRPRAWSTRASLILTRRAATLGSHAGQWALPGGRIDAGETPEQTALREMAEEVGLELEPKAVIGRLDDYVSRSGYVITPVVVWAGAALELVPNPGEVASVHRIAVSEFMRPDAPLLDQDCRQCAPSAAHAGRPQLDRCAHGGHPVPVSRGLYRGPGDAGGAFRAAAVRAQVKSDQRGVKARQAGRQHPLTRMALTY